MSLGSSALKRNYNDPNYPALFALPEQRECEVFECGLPSEGAVGFCHTHFVRLIESGYPEVVRFDTAPIRKLLISCDLSDEDAAFHVGVHPSTVERLRDGSVKWLPLDQADKWVCGLGVIGGLASVYPFEYTNREFYDPLILGELGD